MNLEFAKINKNNIEIFNNLAHAYEAEFSNLTNKMPNEFGIFKIDIFPETPYSGYLLFHEKRPVGFCVINTESNIRDVAEFYIIPVMRKKNLGYRLAEMVFNKYPGQWQVRQIEGALGAINFWRRVINKYTQNRYEESVIEDGHWGKVTCQRFQTTSDGHELINS